MNIPHPHQFRPTRSSLVKKGMTAVAIALIVLASVALGRSTAHIKTKYVPVTWLPVQVASQTPTASTTETTTAAAAANLTSAQLVAIAQNAQPGKSITTVTRKIENGNSVYSFQFSDNSQVDVRANDGAILTIVPGTGNSTPPGRVAQSQPAASNVRQQIRQKIAEAETQKKSHGWGHSKHGHGHHEESDQQEDDAKED